MVVTSPGVVVLGGPNGAGKSTAAPRLLRGSLKVEEFVNADTWRLYDASSVRGPRLVAAGGREAPTRIRDQRTWRLAAEEYADE